MKALLSPAYKKLSNVPSIADEPAAEALLTQMIPCAFYLRAERGDHLPPPSSGPGSSSSSSSSGPPAKQPRALKIAQAQRFKQDEYFVWFLPPSQLKTMLGAVGLVTLVLAGCMFPLWPIKLRIGVWYLSIAVLGLIGLFFGIAIVRLIFWGITKVVYKPGIWIFPKLFDDVGVVSHHLYFQSYVVGPLAHWRGADRIVHSVVGVGRPSAQKGPQEAQQKGCCRSSCLYSWTELSYRCSSCRSCTKIAQRRCCTTCVWRGQGRRSHRVIPSHPTHVFLSYNYIVLPSLLTLTNAEGQSLFRASTPCTPARHC